MQCLEKPSQVFAGCELNASFVASGDLVHVELFRAAEKFPIISEADYINHHRSPRTHNSRFRLHPQWVN
jgi:hypothetical protein